MTDNHILEQVRATLKPQEAKVIMEMRKMSFQTLTIIMEHGKVIHKERKEPIKD
jgi:hypothetical protein